MSRPRAWTSLSTACGAIPSSTSRSPAATGRRRTATCSGTAIRGRWRNPKQPDMRRLDVVDLEPVRPNWLTAGALRLALLSLFVVLTAMVRPRLTHTSAGWLLVAGLGFVVAAAALFALATRRVA